MHSYPHHIGDFRSGTVNMTRQERWIYRDMTDVYYDTEKPLTLDLDVLCNEIGVRTDDERSIVQLILKFKFKRTDDGYVHVRCEEVIADYRKKADIARENGNRGGRPKKAKDNQEKPSGFPSGFDVVATGNQEETGSKTNHKPITNNQEPNTKTSRVPRFDAQAHLESLGVDLKVIDDWLKHRKTKKAVVTDTVIGMHVSQAQKAGISLQDALKICCSRGWVGFEADWLKGNRATQGGVSAPQPNRQEALEARNREVAARVAEKYALEFDHADH